MATVTITIEDTPQGPSNVQLKIESDPPFDVDRGQTFEETFENLARDGTVAQAAACFMVIEQVGAQTLHDWIVRDS